MHMRYMHITFDCCYCFILLAISLDTLIAATLIDN